MHQIGSGSPVLQRFLREWQQLRYRPSALRHAAGWHLVSGPLRDLDQVVELTRPARSQVDAERVLGELVERATHDELAARLLLQRLVPDLVRVHRRRHFRYRAEVEFGDLLTTGWTVIRTYNTARRPARIANALVSDIEYLEYRAAFRRIGHGRPADPVQFDELADEPSPDPTVELAELVADPAADLSDDERDLMRRLVSGRTAVDIARDLEVTPRTLRNRRDRITRKLRDTTPAA